MGSKFLSKLKKVQQVRPIQSDFAFVKMVDYDADVKKELVKFLTLLFRHLIGEGNEISDWDSENNN